MPSFYSKYLGKLFILQAGKKAMILGINRCEAGENLDT